MKLIPEVIIRGGKVLEPGTGRKLEPVPLLRELESALSTEDEDAVFYMVDLDGMERNSFDVNLLERLGEEFRIWFKGGFRRAEFLMDALILGAEVAVMDSATIISSEELEKAVEMSDSVAFSIETGERPKWNRIPGEMGDLISWLNRVSISSVIFTCDSEREIPADSVMHPKYIHGCGEKEGIDGLILPYDIILQRD